MQKYFSTNQKKPNMKQSLFILCLVAMFIMFGSINRAEAQVQITIQNDSDWAFYEMYMTASDYETWGEDLLEMSGQSVLIREEAISISIPAIGYWDLKIIDEDGDECVVTEIYINDHEYVHVTSDMLLDCYK
jgi:hypothetical protein